MLVIAVMISLGFAPQIIVRYVSGDEILNQKFRSANTWKDVRDLLPASDLENPPQLLKGAKTLKMEEEIAGEDGDVLEVTAIYKNRF